MVWLDRRRVPGSYQQTRRQQMELAVLSQAAICLQGMVEASQCPFNAGHQVGKL